MTDQEFLQAFASARLQPDQFDHKAHLKLAYLMLKDHPKKEAAYKVGSLIKDYTISWGATDKYHHTLSLAAVYVVVHFMERKPGLSFEETLQCFPRLLDEFQGLIGHHYSQELLKSEEAKKSFFLPDKIPFDIG